MPLFSERLKKKAKLKLKIKFLIFAPVKPVHIFYSVHRRSMHSATTVWYMNVFMDNDGNLCYREKNIYLWLMVLAFLRTNASGQ